MAAPHNSTRANFVEFKGLQDARNTDSVAFGAFVESENTDITREGKPKRRPGRTKVYDGQVLDTWGDGDILLFVTAAGDLRRLNDDDTSDVLRAGLSGPGRLAATRIANTVYWSFGAYTGVIESGVDRFLGMDLLTPAGFTLIAGSSRLPPGVYRYAWVGVTAQGDEGPLSIRGSFELTERGGAHIIPPIPADTRMTHVRAYLTETNGTQMYRLGTVVAPTNSSEQDARKLEVLPLLESIRPIRENLISLPVFTAAETHNGRLLVAYENLLLYSERFDYEYFSPDEMFIPFSSEVRIIAPVEGGVFVGTATEHFFLDGADVSQSTLRRKASYGAVGHTLDYLEQEEHAFEGADGRIAVWLGLRGPVFGLSGGSMKDSGDGVVSFPSNVVHGAGSVRKHEGDMHYISVVRHK